jgi:AraC-like DNA-binding protein
MPTLEPIADPHAFADGDERAEFARCPWLPGVELYRASLRTHAFDAHVHEGYGVGVIEAGAERFEYRGAGFVAPAGTLVAMNPDTVHTGRAATDAGWRYRMVYVEPSTMAAIAGAVPWFDAPVVESPALAARLSTALRAAWSHDATEPLAIESALADALLGLATAHGRATPGRDGPGAHDTRWRTLVEWIDAHLAEPISLGRLAGVAGIGRFHLVRSLRAAFGITPMALVQARRLVAARRALANGETPAGAAAAAGFADQSHLTRRLLRTHGVTPAQYQHQLGSRPSASSRRSSSDERRSRLR